MMRILIADDDSITRRLLETILTKWSYQVVIAQDGDEAWQILQGEGAPKLAILDWMMPGLDGVEICRRARQRIDAPYVYIMLLTSKVRKEDLIEGMEAGADDYLTKPFNRHELEVRLRAGLRILDLQEALVASSEELAQVRSQEAEMGHRLRSTLLTGEPPALMPGVEVSARTEPGSQLDGDFYDFFPHNDHVLDLVMGDVLGQGLPAALIAAATKNHFLRTLHRAAASGGEPPTPAQIVTQVHDAIGGQFLGQKNFETLCYARFDSQTHQLDYVDCGYSPTVYFEKKTGKCKMLRGDNMPLGIGQQENYRQLSLTFAPGDHFLFHSDGITEALNATGEAFGPDRLTALVQNAVDLSAEELITRVHNAVREFAAEPISAHLTCLVVKITG